MCINMTYNLDNKDQKIIEVLKEHGDYTTRQIAKKTLLPFTTINFRIRKLKQEKIIKKVTIDLDREKIGLPILAFISVTVDYKAAGPSKTLEQDEIAKAVKRISGVQEVMLITGGTDLLVKVLAADVQELNEIVTKKMRKVVGVNKTQTSIVLQEV